MMKRTQQTSKAFGRNFRALWPCVALCGLLAGCSEIKNLKMTLAPPEDDPFYQQQRRQVSKFEPKPEEPRPAAPSDSPIGAAAAPAPTAASLFQHDPRRPEDVGVLSSDIRQSVASGNRWRALLIGISDYSATNGFATSLRRIPVNDVNAIKEVLARDYGFTDVMTLTDGQATRRGILSALTQLHEVCEEEDNVLIYYAGHGHLPTHGVGVWIPADARSEEDGISNSELKDRIANLKARRVLLITDSCFSGAFLTRALGVKAREQTVADPSQSARISASLAKNQRPGREVITSGNLAPVPNEGQGPASEHSPFAYSLLTALKSVPSGGAVSTTDLFVDLYHTLTAQFQAEADRPRPQRSTMPGHAGGEFFLVRR